MSLHFIDLARTIQGRLNSKSTCIQGNTVVGLARFKMAALLDVP